MGAWKMLLYVLQVQDQNEEAVAVLAGMTTALVTPFDADFVFDEAAMRRSVRHQLEAGAAGLCVLGGTGEPLSLTLGENFRAVDTVVEETSGRAPVTVGCLLGAQADIIATARHAEAAGADFIMLAPPYFFSVRPFDIERHVAAVAEACGLPIVFFHTPGRSGVRLGAEELLALIHGNPSIRGIKEASGDMLLAGEVIQGAPDGFAFMQGLDELILPSLALGAAGAILSLGALLPRSLRALFEHAREGRLDRARRIQLDLLPLCRWIYSEPNPAPLKYALELAGSPAGPCRPPIYGPRDATREALRTLLPPFLQAETG